MRKILSCSLLIAATVSVAAARPNVPGEHQKPANSPRPGQASSSSTAPAAPQFVNGKVVSQTSNSLVVEAAGKRQTFRVSEKSQVAQLKAGAKVVVTYTKTPQGSEVVRAVRKPSK